LLKSVQCQKWEAELLDILVTFDQEAQRFLLAAQQKAQFDAWSCLTT
jgi:hypothetical protein